MRLRPFLLVTRANPATEFDGEAAPDPVRRLFRTVLAQALRDPDRIEWLRSPDGRLVCDLAQVNADWVLRKLAELPRIDA